MASWQAEGPSTRAVHAGEDRSDLGNVGAVNVPVHQSTTFRYPETAGGQPAPYIYSRYENPSLENVEAKVAALEGAEEGRALVFASGMAATAATCMELVRPEGRLLVQRGVYGGTTAYLQDELAPWGVEVLPFDAHDQPSVPDGTAAVWLESITNPLLRVADIPAWVEAAHDVGAKVVVDATFATPHLQRPLELGADVVIHSGSKYLGGHSDVTAGVAVVGSEALRERLWRRRRNWGAVLDPHAAYLLARGVKTLPLRMRAHCANAQVLAESLSGRPDVVVHYPGLADHPDHETARRLLGGGFGGMLTLDLGSLEAAKRFRRATKLVLPAASLGGVESLVSLPVETSHAYAAPEERQADGIADGLVRISVGVEDVTDLLGDVMQALDAARDTR